MSSSQARQLLHWAKEMGGVVFEDGTESEFVFTGPSVRTLACAAPDRVVYFNSFSRTLFPALGVSYIVVPPHAVDRFARAMPATSGVSPTDQLALSEFISNGLFDKHLRMLRQVYGERRGALLTGLKKVFGERIEVDRQMAGLQLYGTVASRIDEESPVDLARRAGVFIDSARPFYRSNELHPGIIFGFARFNIEQIEAAVRILGSVL